MDTNSNILLDSVYQKGIYMAFGIKLPKVHTK